MAVAEHLRAGARLALLPYLLSRAVLDATALIANHFISYGPIVNPGRGTWLQGFLGWDAYHYLGIARHGYPTVAIAASGNNGYFPLLPLLLRALGGSDASALLLGLALGFAALTALAAFSAAVHDGRLARQTVWAAAFWPAAFYWSAIYTESLFLALAIASLWAAWQGRPAVAAGAGFLAALARPTGFALVLPLLLLLPPGRRRLAALAPLAGLLAFAAYLALHTGTPFALPEAFFGHGRLSPGRPWELLGTAFNLARQGDPQQLAEFPIALIAIVLFVALARLQRWRGPAVATTLALLAPPIAAGTISSFARYAMVAFPLYWPGCRLRTALLLAVEIPIAVAWTVFTTTGHLTP